MRSVPAPPTLGVGAEAVVTQLGDMREGIRHASTGRRGMDPSVSRYIDGSEAELVALLDGLRQGFYSVDRDWRLVRFNAMAAEHFSRPADAVLGRVLWDVFPTAGATALGRRFLEAMDSRRAVDGVDLSVVVPGRRLSYRLFPLGAGLAVCWREVRQPASDQFDATLDALPFGMVQVDANLRVASANLAARRMSRERDGLCVGESLTTADPADGLRLRASLEAATTDATAGFRTRLAIRRVSARRKYLLHIQSLQSPLHSAVVTIVDPEQPSRLQEDDLMEFYDLTRAEAGVVALLASGVTLPQIARSRGISFETARTHLARARAKTETSSQVDLVRLLVSSSYV